MRFIDLRHFRRCDSLKRSDSGPLEQHPILYFGFLIFSLLSVSSRGLGYGRPPVRARRMIHIIRNILNLDTISFLLCLQGVAAYSCT